jgi:hypothetical protein
LADSSTLPALSAPEERTDVLNERHIPLLDRALGPLCRLIDFSTERVKYYKPSRREGSSAGLELLD